MVKKISLIVIFALILGLFYGLGKQFYTSLRSGQRLDQEIDSLTKLQAKNTELKKRLVEIGQVQFIEQQARDKLNLSRPGETVVIIPQAELDKVLGLQQEVKQAVGPYWQGWLKLFIK